MSSVNIHEAKTNLSRLVQRVEGGEEIVIARAGKPVAKLVPYLGEKKPREFGFMKGQVWISDDFNDPLPPEILNEFFTDLDLEHPR